MSSRAASISFLQRVLIRFQDAFFDQLIGLWSLLYLLLQAICSHVLLKASLVCLKGWISLGVGEDVAWMFISQRM